MNYFYEGISERLSNLENLARPWHSFTHYLVADLVKNNNKIYYCKKEHVSHDDWRYDFECHDYWEKVSYNNSIVKNLNKSINEKEHINKINKNKKLNRKVFLFDGE